MYSTSSAAPFVYAGLARHSCLPAYAFKRISGGDTLYIELNPTLGLMLERRNMADYYRSGASYLYRIDDQQAGYFLMEKCRGLPLHHRRIVLPSGPPTIMIFQRNTVPVTSVPHTPCRLAKRLAPYPDGTG
ncbi:MAG: hypothetical protein IPH12_09380 [Saprospirales bacterium]|nr:hypothetical protein [Saprospirales bacterium]